MSNKKNVKKNEKKDEKKERTARDIVKDAALKYQREKEEHIQRIDRMYKEKLSLLEKNIKNDTLLDNKDKEILLAYVAFGDVLTPLLSFCNITSVTLKRRIEKRDAFRKHWTEVKNAHASMVSMGLWQAVLRNEPWAVKSYLSTHTEEFAKGAKKSAATFDDYIEKQERGGRIGEGAMDDDVE
jgi:hypothetical protein